MAIYLKYSTIHFRASSFYNTLLFSMNIDALSKTVLKYLKYRN